MPPVLPARDQEFINFCNEHLEVWDSAGGTIGLSPAMLASYSAAVTDLNTTFTAAQNARNASRAATVAFDSKITVARAVAADLVRNIKNYAENQPDPGAIYSAAQIPPPSAPTPAPLPTKPTDINVQLNSDGSVTLSWASENASASSGAFFNITRKLPGQAMFFPLGGSPGGTPESGRRMFFTDATIPSSAAATGAQYIIQGYRGTRSGEASDVITVQFGIDGEGAFVTNATLKMAA